jgi:hypothetical protein
MLVKKKGWGKFLAIALIFTFLFHCIGMIVPEQASAATTELTISRYADDGETILEQKKVDYHWLENPDNIPVCGNGEIRYYHQGPVFIYEPADDPVELERLRWNEEEDQNWYEKDMGAVKGTNVKDLCNLVGGMKEGEEVEIKAIDGFKKTFAYKNVYNYDPDREGPMVVCWSKDGLYPDTGYADGMRLVWFAAATYKDKDNIVNPAEFTPGEYHVFGNWDWHEAADPQYWYYYNGEFPTTTGLSVQYVAYINIYSNDPAPPCPVTLTADETDNIVGQAIDITFADDPDWREAIIGIKVNNKALTDAQYTVTAGNINIAADVFTEAKDYTIAVQTIGYKKATVTQTINLAPPIALTVDGNVLDSPINYTVDDLKAMPVSNVVNGGKTYTGVAVDYLLSTLGTAEDDWVVTVKIKDSPNPIDLSSYSNPILAYERDGQAFEDIYGGETTYLRLATETTNIKYVYWMTVSQAALTAPVLTADNSDNEVGQEINLSFADDADWRAAISGITVNGIALADGQYTVTAGNISLAAEVFTEAGDYEIAVQAAGYEDATVTQTIVENQPQPTTLYVDASGGADFTSIQGAVTAANAGDTIIVKDGTYIENITVDKTLVIQSENGAAQTIVQAANTGADVIKVTAENVTINGLRWPFCIQSSGLL